MYEFCNCSHMFFICLVHHINFLPPPLSFIMSRRNRVGFGFLRDNDVTNLKFNMADKCCRVGRSAIIFIYIEGCTFANSLIFNQDYIKITKESRFITDRF